jgi:hypothetical protein
MGEPDASGEVSNKQSPLSPPLHRRLRRPHHHGTGRKGPDPPVAGEARRGRAGGPLRQPHRPARPRHRGPQPDWYERNTGRKITAVQTRVKHPVIAFMAATLDGVVAGAGAVYEAGRCQRPTQSHQAFLRLRKRTPAPPPFSSMNTIPAASRAFCSFSRASSETLGPKPPSRRLTVGSERPAREARSV